MDNISSRTRSKTKGITHEQSRGTMTKEEVKALIQELRDEIPAIIEKFNEDKEAADTLIQKAAHEKLKKILEDG